MHSPTSRNRKHAVFGALILTIFLTQARAQSKTPWQVEIQIPLEHSLPTLVHGVDDVGPAFKNATEAALEKGKVIIKKYSNVLRIAAIPTGFAVTFFGYFLLAPVLFLAGFVSGGGACFIAVNAALGDTTQAAAWIAIVAMLLGGAMIGFLALRALSIGMFAVGAALGVVLASALKTTLIASAYPKDPQLAFIVASVVCGLIFGTIALCLQKQMLIFSTAYAGSFGAMFGIGHFAGHFPSAEDLNKVESGEVNGWVVFYIILTLGLGTLGMLFQFWLSKGKAMPRHAPHDRRRRRRRVRSYEPDDWSDDDWDEDVYVERPPTPRRKYEQHQPSELPVTVPSNEHMLKIEVSNARQNSYAPSAPESWNDVRHAANIFEEDSSAKESDQVYSTPLPNDTYNRREVVQQASPDIEHSSSFFDHPSPDFDDASEHDHPVAKPHLDVAPGTEDLLGATPDTAIDIDVDNVAQKQIVHASADPLDIADGFIQPASPSLVGVSLDSDNEVGKAV